MNILEIFPRPSHQFRPCLSSRRGGGAKGGGKVVEDSEPFVDLWGDDSVGEASSSTTLSRARELSEGPEVRPLLFASC